MPLNQRTNNQKTIEERLKRLESEYSTIEKLYQTVKNIEKGISDGHFCKWNTEIGRQIEFRVDQKNFRERLELDLKQGKKEIANLKMILNELKTGKEILERVETSQKKMKNEREKEQRQNRRTLIVAVGIVVLTFILNLVLDLIKQNI
jgi:hypothetical protein